MQRTKNWQYTIHIFDIFKYITNVPMQIYLLKSFDWFNIFYFMYMPLVQTTDGFNMDNHFNIGFNFVRECLVIL